LQGLDQRKLQREATDRLNEFAESFKNLTANLSGKNLGEEGAAYLAENLTFNDRYAPRSLLSISSSLDRWLTAGKLFPYTEIGKERTGSN
jgi:hypothetical protein